jgi:uncharacterized membrane protein YphA (DoxX/SURF4 family)
MDTVFTIVQVVLGLIFIGAGAGHYRALAGGPIQRGMEWISDLPATPMRVLAVLEILGGLALIGTVVTGTTWLAALTAACFLLLMVAAMVFHARRPGESQNIAFNAILGIGALIVLYANLT